MFLKMPVKPKLSKKESFKKTSEFPNSAATSLKSGFSEFLEPALCFFIHNLSAKIVWQIIIHPAVLLPLKTVTLQLMYSFALSFIQMGTKIDPFGSNFQANRYCSRSEGAGESQHGSCRLHSFKLSHVHV